MKKTILTYVLALILGFFVYRETGWATLLLFFLVLSALGKFIIEVKNLKNGKIRNNKSGGVDQRNPHLN